MKKNFFVAALSLGAATLASTLLSAPAKAQVTATVPITVEIPNIVFLETYESIKFVPSVADLSSTGSDEIIAGAGTAGDTTNGLSATISATTALGAGTLPTFTSSKELTDVIVYKVWGLGGDDGEINHVATYSGALVKDDSTVGLTVEQLTTNKTAPGLTYANAIEGKLKFTFNFSGVTASGLHEGGTLTITATAE